MRKTFGAGINMKNELQQFIEEFLLHLQSVANGPEGGQEEIQFDFPQGYVEISMKKVLHPIPENVIPFPVKQK